jgi:hypothetical protein
MYFFKSVLDEAHSDVQGGQIMVRNITGRLFRVGTPGRLVKPDGLAIVSENDPIVQHNLKLKRIAVVPPTTSSSSATTAKKPRKKKAQEPAEVKDWDVVGDTKVDVVIDSEPAAEPEPVEVAETITEIPMIVEQHQLAPNVDESSL